MRGAGSVDRMMLVQIQSSALVSRWCNGTHKTLLRSWSWFESRSGYLQHGPWVCRKACQLPKLLDQVRLLDGLLTTRPASVLDSTADFGSARRGSIPRRAASQDSNVLGVCRIKHATVRRSRTKFDSWREPSKVLGLIREPYRRRRCPMFEQNYDERPFFSRR